MAKKSTSSLFPAEEVKPIEKEDLNLPEENVSETVETESFEETESESVPELPNVSKPTDDVIDVEINAIKKQRFRFNSGKIVELNVRDLTISYRLKEVYDNLNTMMEQVGEKLSSIPEDDLTGDIVESGVVDKVIDSLKEIDGAMRKEIDKLFDAPISEAVYPHGSMYDPIGGVFAYEHILDKVSQLYENELHNEFSKLKQRVANRTAKYTKVQRVKKYHK